MTPATLERAEQPFYSANAKRVGMGLATNRHLIAKYHGSMSISSKPESGTTVQIVLQIVDPDFLKEAGAAFSPFQPWQRWISRIAHTRVFNVKLS